MTFSLYECLEFLHVKYLCLGIYFPKLYWGLDDLGWSSWDLNWHSTCCPTMPAPDLLVLTVRRNGEEESQIPHGPNLCSPCLLVTVLTSVTEGREKKVWKSHPDSPKLRLSGALHVTPPPPMGGRKDVGMVLRQQDSSPSPKALWVWLPRQGVLKLTWTMSAMKILFRLDYKPKKFIWWVLGGGPKQQCVRSLAH